MFFKNLALQYIFLIQIFELVSVIQSVTLTKEVVRFLLFFLRIKPIK